MELISKITRVRTALGPRPIEASDIKPGQEFRIVMDDGTWWDTDVRRVMTNKPGMYLIIEPNGDYDTVNVEGWPATTKYAVLEDGEWIREIEDETHVEEEDDLRFSDLQVGELFYPSYRQEVMYMKVTDDQAIYRDGSESVERAARTPIRMNSGVRVLSTGVVFR